MPKSNRCIILAAVGCLTLAASPPRDGADGQKRRSEHAESHPSPSALSPVPIDPIPASEHDQPCQPGEQNRKSELCAEWQATDQAREASKWAARSFWVGLAGVLGLLYSLHLTRKATNIAVDAAKDAESAMALTSKSVQATLEIADSSKRALYNDRAWFTWDHLNFGPLKNTIVDGERIQDGLVIVAFWKNTGRSPAHNVTCTNKKALIDLNADVPYFDITDDDATTQQSSRGVSAEVSGTLLAMNDSEAFALRAQLKRLIYYSRVEYRDIFSPGEIRVSEACLDIIVTGGTVTVDGKIQPAISIMTAGNQNAIT